MQPTYLADSTNLGEAKATINSSENKNRLYNAINTSNVYDGMESVYVRNFKKEES